MGVVLLCYACAQHVASRTPWELLLERCREREVMLVEWNAGGSCVVVLEAKSASLRTIIGLGAELVDL